MIFNYLIFLFIGTYITCVPIEKVSLNEAIKCTNVFLTKIKNDVSKPLVDIPETLTDGCMKDNLKIFAESLGKLSQFLADPSCDTIILKLSEKWPEAENTDENCTTIQGKPRLLLQNLFNQLKEAKDVL